MKVLVGNAGSCCSQILLKEASACELFSGSAAQATYVLGDGVHEERVDGGVRRVELVHVVSGAAIVGLGLGRVFRCGGCYLCQAIWIASLVGFCVPRVLATSSSSAASASAALQLRQLA